MKTFFDCIPCFVRQALDSARFITPDETVHEQVLREVLRAIGEMDLRQSPPVMGQHIHRVIRRFAGCSDPYRQVKDRFNRLAVGLYPDYKTLVERSDSPMETAIRLAIAGNVIDFAVRSDLSESFVHDAVMHALRAHLDGTVEEFAEAVSGADRILYLADNAGEIVFDRLLIEQISPEKVTLVVKGSPVINDATMTDAEATGLTDLVECVDNGSDAPGTILDDCSEAFRERFEKADLVIAKGQANYETLSDVDRDLFFVLKAKCPVIAEDLGRPVDSLVLLRSSCSEKEGTGVIAN